MMRGIVSLSLRFRYLVVFLAGVVMLFGIARIRGLPVDVFPEFAPPRVEIQTAALGLSPEEIESLITVPLENALNGVAGLDVLRSKSVSQLSSIELIFQPGTDLIQARQLVQERLAIVTPTLPSWSTPPHIMPPLSATSRAMKIGLSSDTLSVTEMSTLVRFKIRQRLLRVPGVANVAIWGFRAAQLQVQIDPERLQAYGVTIDEIMEASGGALDAGLLSYTPGSFVGTGGWIETEDQRVGIEHITPFLEAEDLAQVPIGNHRTSDGDWLRLGDVAELVDSHQPLVGDAVIDGGPGLLLIVEKFPWGNTLDVSRGVEAAIDEMRPGLPGINIDTTIFRPATFIEVAINNLGESLLLGAGLVVLVLLIFLWDFRIALISATIVPLTVVITLLVLSFFGTTINVMVLAGLAIAIGAVVDDAIVDVENIVRRLRQFRREGSDLPTGIIVLDASVEVRNSIVYASLIEMSALLPVFFLQGLSGAFFQPLAQAYVVATLVSPLVALTVTPALIYILLSGAPVTDRESPILPWLHRSYDRLLALNLKAPRVAYATIVVIMLAGGLVWPLMGQELLPSFKERDFLMHWLTKPGTSLPEMVRISTQASYDLQNIAGVRNFGAHIGQAQNADEVYGVYFGENWISVEPEVDYDTTVASIQSTVNAYPGLYKDVQTYLKERIREVLTGSSDAIVVRIYGDDLDYLRDKAEEIRLRLSEIEGMSALHVELLVDEPQVEIEVNLTEAERYGLKPGDIRRAAGAVLASVEVSDIWTPSRVYDVRVIGTPETRNNVESIRELLIDTPSGGYVRLGDVADVRVNPTPNSIRRQNASRRIDVSANVRGRDVGAVANDVERALQEIEFPLGSHAELLGEYAERQAAQGSILVAAIAATLIIFSLLRISLGNWRLSILSFLSLPMALVGGVLAAALVGGVISLGSIVGFLTILGVAARNGIMMINHFQHLEEFEGETFGPALVVRGARERVAPIMMTALTAGLALVPLVIAGNIPGHEIEHPMAIVILGGLVTSTLLNLFVVPTLYLRFGRNQQRTMQLHSV
jgi:CzcA family heavy metal efflux pump